MGTFRELDVDKIRLFFADHEKTLRMAAVIAVIFLSVLFFWTRGSGETLEIEAPSQEQYESGEATENSSPEDSTANVTAETAYVDICGEVRSPGVYKVDTETRVFQVIELAGGLTGDADIYNLNRAEKVFDGQKIQVPKLGEDPQVTGQGSAVSGDGKININTAESSLLQTIPGIGPAKASRIIDYRETVGRFNSIEEIMNVSGIGEATFQSIRDYIKV
ncbi:MAG: helix-hairpin-helix domain-containing protein [Firmicutes bacterium]|nr:helix-hairpin-helix domain-containing protein [Bacillota bacterium]